MKDGTARRVPSDQADDLVSSGAAKRFISNTVYKALKLGIEVKNHGTRDEDGALKKRIQDAQGKHKAAAHKADVKKKQKKEEAAKHREAQAILDED